MFHTASGDGGAAAVAVEPTRIHDTKMHNEKKENIQTGSNRHKHRAPLPKSEEKKLYVVYMKIVYKFISMLLVQQCQFPRF